MTTIHFFTTPKPLISFEKFYKPPECEVEIIKKFIQVGWNPYVNSVERPQGITDLEGFFWVLGDTVLHDCSKYKDEKIFLLVYYTGEITKEGLEIGKKYFSKLLFENIEDIEKYESAIAAITKPEEFNYDFELPDGRRVTRIIGGERSKHVDEYIDKITKTTCSLSSRGLLL